MTMEGWGRTSDADAKGPLRIRERVADLQAATVGCTLFWLQICSLHFVSQVWGGVTKVGKCRRSLLPRATETSSNCVLVFDKGQFLWKDSNITHRTQDRTLGGLHTAAERIQPAEQEQRPVWQMGCVGGGGRGWVWCPGEERGRGWCVTSEEVRLDRLVSAVRTGRLCGIPPQQYTTLV
jgi:hypothetical protein